MILASNADCCRLGCSLWVRLVGWWPRMRMGRCWRCWRVRVFRRLISRDRRRCSCRMRKCSGRKCSRRTNPQCSFPLWSSWLGALVGFLSFLKTERSTPWLLSCPQQNLFRFEESRIIRRSDLSQYGSLAKKADSTESCLKSSYWTIWPCKIAPLILSHPECRPCRYSAGPLRKQKYRSKQTLDTCHMSWYRQKRKTTESRKVRSCRCKNCTQAPLKRS